MEPDLPFLHKERERSAHASTLTARQKESGFEGGWEWTDGDLITPFGPFSRSELHPPFVCTRCKAKIVRFTPVYVGADIHKAQTYDSDQYAAAKLCGPCKEQLETWLGEVPGRFAGQQNSRSAAKPSTV